ncbi:MAG TPA: hypothetical protein VFC31_04905 [Candidatus Limnocylindria bacterium]|nr:hypothetical protein [Candidatus Limnocylindria bacterium]
MSEHEPRITEQPRLEEHRVYALLAFPIFGITLLIVVLIATLGTK